MEISKPVGAGIAAVAVLLVGIVAWMMFGKKTDSAVPTMTGGIPATATPQAVPPDAGGGAGGVPPGAAMAGGQVPR
jgi:hypothetical protein